MIDSVGGRGRLSNVMGIAPPLRTQAVRRAASRWCRAMGWAPLHEVPLRNGRRADILALRPDGGFCCVEIKSCAADFLSDRKWPEYREFANALFFAVDEDFPLSLLPGDVGLIVAADGEAVLLREAPVCLLAPSRRRALLAQFAMLAALRLEQASDPVCGFPLRAE